LDKIVVTVPSAHLVPARCGFRPGSAAGGHGSPASFSARAALTGILVKADAGQLPESITSEI
jgi:hypothetical protein